MVEFAWRCPTVDHDLKFIFFRLSEDDSPIFSSGDRVMTRRMLLRVDYLIATFGVLGSLRPFRTSRRFFDIPLR